MNDFIKKQPKIRREKIQLLESYLKNPGRFSILILGNRGTGKEFWTKNLFQKIHNKEDTSKKIIQLNTATAQSSVEFWKEKLREAHKGILMIKDVEQLSEINQEILFEGMATHDGKYGFEEKNFEVRIVFTSSRPISILRDTEDHLTHKFFDRITQLVVKFPSLDESPNAISKDLKRTWEKFEFEDALYPQSLDDLLQEDAHKFHGNFRDLDKLCINWNNYQRMELEEKQILEKIRKDFSEHYHFPEYRNESDSGVFFSKEKSYQATLDEFRIRFKSWAKEEYGTLRKAGEALGFNHRTAERW